MVHSGDYTIGGIKEALAMAGVAVRAPSASATQWYTTKKDDTLSA
jgi:hypothetical protein